MRAVRRRVAEVKVAVDGQMIGSVERGRLVYLGVRQEDAAVNASFMADRLANLRIVPAAEAGKMNRRVMEIGGGGN